MSGSNPPSTNGSPCVARRALTTSAVAVVAMALPVALVATTAAFASDEASAASAPLTDASFGEFDLVVAQAISLATPAVIATDGPEAPINEPAPESTTSTVAPPPPPPTTVAPAPAPPPAPPAEEPAPSEPPAGGDPNDPASWERLAACESGGDWAINTGNGYYGGIQFSLRSWRGVGGTGYPHEASKETQIEMGKRLHSQGGWRHWPACTRSFGWR